MRLINCVRKSGWPAMATFAISKRVLRASRLEVPSGFRVIVHAPAARSARAAYAGVGNDEVRLGVRSSAFDILSYGEATKGGEAVWSVFRWVAEKHGPGQSARTRSSRRKWDGLPFAMAGRDCAPLV